MELREIIDWHNRERRVAMAGAMAMGELLTKTRFHDEAVKLLTATANELRELRDSAQKPHG